MSLEQRVDKVEEAISIMKTLLVSHDERLENYLKALNQTREDFEFKLNALIDSQIRTEAELIELKEASQSQLNRIENLENK